jgi:mRNA-degrading endonuclease RelE of RelBE toxin-antitoxin system
VYTVIYAEDVAEDLNLVPKNLRGSILDHAELQLRHEPTRQTRNRKILVGLLPPWDHLDPVWELRIGEYRVFYDVDELEAIVTVRAIRRKPPRKRTEDTL